MQQFLNLMRRLVIPAALVLLLWAGYQVIARPYISDRNGKILVVYDGDATLKDCSERATRDDEPMAVNKENESEQALAGFCKAMPKSGQEDLLNLHTELHEGPPEGKAARVYQQLGARVANDGRVLGVISLLASPDCAPLVRFCRAMQIPLLLAIAANDDLMAPAEDTHGIVFRMMPTNRLQALDMATWVRENFHDQQNLHVAVFHEANSFGEYLNQQLAFRLQPETKSKKVILYNYEVTEPLGFADLMPQLWCASMDVVVYLGYQSRALDLMNKLNGYRADVNAVSCPPRAGSRSFENLTVLLASGAYQEELNDTAKYKFTFKVLAMLPTPPASNKKVNPDLPKVPRDDDDTQASEYGFDSYSLLLNLADQRFRTPSQPMRQSATGHSYGFDDSGELRPAEKNRYQAYRLASSEAWRLPKL